MTRPQGTLRSMLAAGEDGRVAAVVGTDPDPDRRVDAVPFGGGGAVAGTDWFGTDWFGTEGTELPSRSSSRPEPPEPPEPLEPLEPLEPDPDPEPDPFPEPLSLALAGPITTSNTNSKVRTRPNRENSERAPRPHVLVPVARLT